MLKINLVPVERRKLEKTPIPRFLLIIGEAVALTLVAIGCVFYIMKINNIEKDKKELTETLNGLKIHVQEYDSASAELKDLQEQENQITQVVSRPISWSETIDSIWDVVNNNKKIWLSEIMMVDASGVPEEFKKIAPGATFDRAAALKCNALGNDLSAMTDFRKDLKTNPKVSTLFNIINIAPDYKVEEGGKSISFEVFLVRTSFGEKK